MKIQIKTINSIELSRGLQMMVVQTIDTNNFIFEVDDEEETELLRQEIEELSDIDQLHII